MKLFNSLRGLGSSETWGRFIENTIMSQSSNLQSLRERYNTWNNNLSSAVSAYNQQLQTSRTNVSNSKSVYILNNQSTTWSTWNTVSGIVTTPANGYMTIATNTLVLDRAAPATMFFFNIESPGLRDNPPTPGTALLSIFVNGIDILTSDPYASTNGDPVSLNSTVVYFPAAMSMYLYPTPAQEFVIEVKLYTSVSVTSSLSLTDINVVAVPQI